MLLLATIQKMVNNDAKELVFYEKYEFEHLGSWYLKSNLYKKFFTETTFFKK